jgi:multidrug efflux pump subunit AcrB
MREVTGPVVAIVLVLASVFVPVAFLGGLAGQLYRQFAITIAISVTISGLVALTLSPALCALVLRDRREAEGGFFGLFNHAFHRGTSRYVSTVRWMLKHSRVGLALFLGVILAAFALFRVVPGALVPLEDQGYFIAASLLPDGASLTRTHEHSVRVEKLLMADPSIEHVATINGFDFIGGGNNSSVSTMFVILKRWNQRTAANLGIDATIGRFFGQTMGMKEALVFAFNPPPIQGLGSTGGFEVYVQNKGEGGTPRLAQVTQELMAKLNQDPRLLGVRTLFRADSPQVRVTLDREKASALGVGVDQVFGTLRFARGPTTSRSSSCVRRPERWCHSGR